MQRPYLAEAIGTFALVFAGTGAIVINDVSGGTIGHGGIALTFGLVVMAMIYAFGDLSGAHLNPAVTVGFFLARRTEASSVLPFIGAQLAGATVASGLLAFLFRDHLSLGSTIPAGTVWQSFVLEVVLTYLLMLVILQVSSGSKEVGTLAGIAIGGVVALEAMFAGPICGASMNPARSIAPAIVSGNGLAMTTLWIYIAAPLLGVIFAVPTNHYLRAERPIVNDESKPSHS